MSLDIIKNRVTVAVSIVSAGATYVTEVAPQVIGWMEDAFGINSPTDEMNSLVSELFGEWGEKKYKILVGNSQPSLNHVISINDKYVLSKFPENIPYDFVPMESTTMTLEQKEEVSYMPIGGPTSNGITQYVLGYTQKGNELESTDTGIQWHSVNTEAMVKNPELQTHVYYDGEKKFSSWLGMGK